MSTALGAHQALTVSPPGMQGSSIGFVVFLKMSDIGHTVGWKYVNCGKQVGLLHYKRGYDEKRNKVPRWVMNLFYNGG